MVCSQPSSSSSVCAREFLTDTLLAACSQLNTAALGHRPLPSEEHNPSASAAGRGMHLRRIVNADSQCHKYML